MRHQAPRLGRRARVAFVTALLLPYLLIQSIAAGVMPVMTDDGLTFVICSGKAGPHADARHGGSGDDQTGPHADGGPCPWAVAHAPVALPAAPEASRLATLAHSFAASEAGPTVPHPAAALSPPARAPPAAA